MITLNISEEFSETPGGRFISDGPFSGELFRENFLYPRYLASLKHDDQLEINFDGCYGFAACFLEEAFGGLVRKYHIIGLLDRLRIISSEDADLPVDLRRYVLEAEEALLYRA